MAVAACLGALTLTGAALGALCTDYHQGSDTLGTLCGNCTVDLTTDWIISSDWNGNLAYDANRLYSSGSVSYHQYVSSGYWQYSTSGVALRATEIIRGGYTGMTSWFVNEYVPC